MTTSDQTMKNEFDAKKEIVRQFGEAINNGDYKALDNLLTANFVRHSQAAPEVNISSLEEFKQFVKMSLQSIPDINGKIAELWIEWDNMAMLTQFGLLPPPQ